MLPTATSQVAGFRYFNVYGPREYTKGRMASVAFHHFNQFRERQGQAVRRVRRLRPGMQSRDFVFVDDVVAVEPVVPAEPGQSGIFNLGSGAPSLQ